MCSCPERRAREPVRLRTFLALERDLDLDTSP
jgi:hypothetical protein